MIARSVCLLAALAAIAMACTVPVRVVGTTVKDIRTDGNTLILTQCELLLRGEMLVVDRCAEKTVSVAMPQPCGRAASGAASAPTGSAPVRESAAGQRPAEPAAPGDLGGPCMPDESCHGELACDPQTNRCEEAAPESAR